MAEEARQPRRANRLQVDASIAEAVTRRAGEWVTLGGIVSGATTVSTAQGGRMAVVTLSDFHASIEVVVRAATLERFEPQLDDVVLAGGRLSRRGRRTVLTAQLIERYDWAALREHPV